MNQLDTLDEEIKKQKEERDKLKLMLKDANESKDSTKYEYLMFLQWFNYFIDYWEICA